eukprot:CAMPEP_0113565908 /NCGR_PEP_ID=MMETSP0015_2-20120614/22434_1 /TAXON_ID=2838 /ORGANISM="Odontella" /LENGTH=49 /DNA_ID=CAMNT_0000468149 /DNA_START=258 /DNA_END=407 /DNA_ORIENTATION=+ /assembly_acc=CAM_ASM_000160
MPVNANTSSDTNAKAVNRTVSTVAERADFPATLPADMAMANLDFSGKCV